MPAVIHATCPECGKNINIIYDESWMWTKSTPGWSDEQEDAKGEQIYETIENFLVDFLSAFREVRAKRKKGKQGG